MSLCLSVFICRGRSRKTEGLLHFQEFFPQQKGQCYYLLQGSLSWAELSADTHFNSQADTQFSITLKQVDK